MVVSMVGSPRSKAKGPASPGAAAPYDAVKTALAAFTSADDIRATVSSYWLLRSACGLDDPAVKGREAFEIVNAAARASPAAPLRIKELLERLSECWVEHEAAATACRGTRVVISGAGPSGLRAAVECALVGMDVRVLERCTTFSRVDVLSMWPQLADDLAGLGLRALCAPLAAAATELSTRELQLALLKSGLLLGVSFSPGAELVGVEAPRSDSQDACWRAWVAESALGSPSLHAANAAAAGGKVRSPAARGIFTEGRPAARDGDHLFGAEPLIDTSSTSSRAEASGAEVSSGEVSSGAEVSGACTASACASGSASTCSTSSGGGGLSSGGGGLSAAAADSAPADSLVAGAMSGAGSGDGGAEGGALAALGTAGGDGGESMGSQLSPAEPGSATSAEELSSAQAGSAMGAERAPAQAGSVSRRRQPLADFDQAFARPPSATPPAGAGSSHPFDALLVAEGEGSATLRRLGVRRVSLFSSDTTTTPTRCLTPFRALAVSTAAGPSSPHSSSEHVIAVRAAGRAPLLAVATSSTRIATLPLHRNPPLAS